MGFCATVFEASKKFLFLLRNFFLREFKQGCVQSDLFIADSLLRIFFWFLISVGSCVFYLGFVCLSSKKIIQIYTPRAHFFVLLFSCFCENYISNLITNQECLNCYN